MKTEYYANSTEFKFVHFEKVPKSLLEELGKRISQRNDSFGITDYFEKGEINYFRRGNIAFQIHVNN